MKARRIVIASALAIAVGALAAAAVSIAGDAGVEPASSPPTVLDEAADAVAAGRHWRLDTPNGPIHVWVPAGYHPDGAATVLYAHGYYDSLDKAWNGHRLPQQFALSGLNAVFIAPEVPAGSRERIYWPSLADLLTYVFQTTDVARPMGPVVAMGHSGAYRTLFAWMTYPDLDLIVSLDAMYGELDTWHDWLDASPSHRLIMVGDDTASWTEELARDLGEQVVTLDRFPDSDVALGATERAARVLYIRSQFGHMPIIVSGIPLPEILRLLPAEILPDAPWREPLGLPPMDAGPPDSLPTR